MRYWLVTCHFGHCGNGRSIDVSYAIATDTLAHACNIARKMPGVKHTRMVMACKEITQEEYEERKQESVYNKFKGGRRR